MQIIPATWEARGRRIKVQDQLQIKTQDLIQKILTKKKKKTQLNRIKWTKDTKRLFTHTQKSKSPKCMSRLPISSVLREIQIKSMM
jgi:hypothetical protein